MAGQNSIKTDEIQRQRDRDSEHLPRDNREVRSSNPRADVGFASISGEAPEVPQADLTWDDIIKQAPMDERCDSKLAREIVDRYLKNWTGYTVITVKTIHTSFPVNKNTARKAYRILKEERTDLVFPKARQPAIYIFICTKCKKTTWHASDTDEFENRLCSKCLKLTEVKKLPEEEVAEEETQPTEEEEPSEETSSEEETTEEVPTEEETAEEESGDTTSEDTPA